MSLLDKYQIILSALISNNPEIGNHINGCEECRSDRSRYGDGIIDLFTLFTHQMDKGSSIESILRVDSVTGNIQQSISQRIANNHN